LGAVSGKLFLTKRIIYKNAEKNITRYRMHDYFTAADRLSAAAFSAGAEENRFRRAG
jgi:hypothetical protein